MKKTRAQKAEPTYAYAFKKDQIIGQSDKGKPVLYKVIEDMKTNDHRSQLRVVKLEQQDKQKNGKVTYKEAEEILLPVKERTKIVENVEVKTTKPNPKNKTTITFFTFPQDTLQEIAKSVRQVPAKSNEQKKQVSSESNSEDEEPPKKFTVKKGVKQEVVKQPVKKEVKKGGKTQKQESSEVEPESPELPKKLPARTTRAQAKQKTVTEDEEEQSSSSQPPAPKKKNAKKTSQEKPASVTQAVPKKPAPRGRAKTQTQKEEDEEEEVEESQSQSQDQKKKKSTKKEKEPTKFMKGKANPLYRTERHVSDQFEGTSQKFHDYSSIVMNNKEVIRAAKIGSKKLLDDIFAHSTKISNLHQRWAPENDVNALEVIFQRQDKAMLLQFIKSFNKLNLGVTPRCSLKEIQTGYNDKYAYGARTRKVAVGRGGREGNNAFVYDLNQSGEMDIERLLTIETDPEFFGLMIAQLGNEHEYYQSIALAVRCGNWKTAGYLVQTVFDKGQMYGFNQVHVDVLNYTSASRIGAIKKPSATKKTQGQYLITPIHCAAINPNHACLQKLIDISQEFNILDEIHRKPVHYAAVSQTDNCLKYLLENGVDAREGDRSKTTPLMLAAQYGRTHNVELLAANNINGKNREGNAAIHLAAQGGHLETVKCLLKHGAQINQPGQNRMTPLILASAYGHFNLVKYLLENGAKILMKDKYGRSSCLMAARNGNVKVLSHLLYNGADYNQPDSSKNTPLHYAAAYGFPECIEELMKAGADQNLTNSWKLTPLSVALQKNHFGVVKTLLNYPTTDVNCKDDEGRTLISSSLSQFNADSFEYIKFLILEKNADVTIGDLQNKTPLHYAVLISRKNVKQYYQKWSEMTKVERRDIKNNYSQLIEQLIELLLNAGADVDLPDKNGQTPFIQALMAQNFSTVELLMKLRNPKVDHVDTRDRNILHKLIECKLFLNVKGYTILENILNNLDPSFLNQHDENGWSPLLYLISEYTKSAEQQHATIHNKKISSLQVKLFEEKIAALPKDPEIQEENKQVVQQQEVSSEGDEEHEEDEEEDEEIEEEEEEENIPRKKKVAYRHPAAAPSLFGQFGQQPSIFATQQAFGGPSKGLFGQQQQFQFGGASKGAFGQPPAAQPNTFQLHTRTFYYNTKPIIVFLTHEQAETIRQETIEASFLLQETVLKLFQKMVNLGAKADAVVIKRKKFREPTPEVLQSKEDPYVAEGNFTIAHFVFRTFYSVSFLQGLLRISKLSLTDATHKNLFPIHLFAQTCSIAPICGRQNETGETFLKYVIDQIDIQVKDENNNTPTSILGSRYYETLGVFIEIMLEHGGSVNNLNKQNEVPLHKWVKSNNLKIVEHFLTKYKACPNFTDKQKRTSLHHAINSSNSQADASFEMEHLLIINGAASNARDKLERTPLFYAFTKIDKPSDFAEIDPFETVSSILADKNCEVNCVDVYQRSPLHYAALRGSVISGRYMIKLKAPVDEPDKYGNTPLGLAFISGHSNFCTMLIDNNANVSRDAIVVDFQKIRDEEKKNRDERRAQGEEIESDDDENSASLPQEEEESINNNRLFGGARTKQTARMAFGQKAPYGFNTNSSAHQLPQPTKFPPGTYSYFKLAIKQGWQGVAYLLITDGYDLQRAIEDAMMEGQFKLVRTLLMKVKSDTVVQKYNANQQNLFHVFALKGAACAEDMAYLIVEELTRRGVDKHSADNEGNIPLHYACKNNCYQLIKYLLHQHCDPNKYNNNQNTPFTIRLQQNFRVFSNPTELALWTSSNVNMNVKFKVHNKQYVLSPFLYLIQEHHLDDEIILSQFIDAGCDINEKTSSGESSLILAIKINSLKLVTFITSHTNFKPDAHAVDATQRTPIHHVVQPLAFGSYENTEMLDKLAKTFDVNGKDNQGKTPLDYANDQDSGVMAEALLKYNAQASKKQKQPRLPTSVVSQAQWVEEEIDIDADAQKFLDLNGEQLDDTKKDLHTIVDQYANQQGQLEVWCDKDIGPYSLLMTKVDIGNGHYSENVFYKMQVLHELNRNVYILFTRWGRIGTSGQHQLTPFESADEAIKEFCKIFFTKAGGNDWRKIRSGEEEFVKKPGKYQLMNVRKLKNYKTLLAPFDFSKKSPYPPCTLDYTIKRVIFQFTQVKLYQKDLEQFHVDLDFMPIERLDKKQLEQAKAILNELTDSVEELKALRSKSELDIKKISNVSSEIADKSSRFYELIPVRELRTEPLPPLESIEAINQKLLLIETLLNFEITSKILLGAHLNKMALSPLNYCFNALNVRVVTLPKEHPEFSLITEYINQSQQPIVSNIFAIERRGEAERFENNKQFNRLLLWHGSKISNFMGILAQGLKVAPPWAFNTGAMFGKGIYFADMFQKSYGYTEDWTLVYNAYNGMFQQGGYWNRQPVQVKDEQEEIQRYRYMLLCEVAVGKPQELYNAEYVTDLPKQYQSVKGCGRRGPDYQQSVVLANGCKVPVGSCIDYPDPKKKDKNGNPISYMLQHNEFIVYDESKVRVRYMVQIDTKTTVDEY